MEKYNFYIICKSEDIFLEKERKFYKYKDLICECFWIPSVFLKLTDYNTELLSKLNTRYNTLEKNRLRKLGCIAAHRNVLLSIINNMSINNLILEEDATLEYELPPVPEKTCYMGGWIIPPKITLAGKVKPKVKPIHNTLNDIDYDKFKILMAHAYFIKSVDIAKKILYSTLEPEKIKNYDIHLVDNKFINKFYYPSVFVQSKHISDIEGKINKNDVYTKNYGLS